MDAPDRLSESDSETWGVYLMGFPLTSSLESLAALPLRPCGLESEGATQLEGPMAVLLAKFNLSALFTRGPNPHAPTDIR